MQLQDYEIPWGLEEDDRLQEVEEEIMEPEDFADGLD